MNEMYAILMNINGQLNEANGVLAAAARERAADATTFQKLAEDRLQTIYMLAETIRQQDENNRRLTEAYLMLADELL